MKYSINEKSSLIKEICLIEKSKNPIEIATKIMKKDWVNIHGPEHHIIDGVSILVAMHNAHMEFDLEDALNKVIERGLKMPGAMCGYWGICGSCTSIGATLAVVNNTGPLSENKHYKENMEYISKAITKIGEIGGPRCCKRNAYISILTAIEFIKEKYNIDLEKKHIICEFYNKNKQCIGTKCPFNNS